MNREIEIQRIRLENRAMAEGDSFFCAVVCAAILPHLYSLFVAL